MSKSSKAIKTTIEEVLANQSWGFNKLLCVDKSVDKKLLKKAQRKALIAFAADDIFRNSYRSGWKGFFVAFKLHPLLTLWQRDTVVLICRTLFGEGIYNWLLRQQKKFTKVVS
jgi:hypothetical protein